MKIAYGLKHGFLSLLLLLSADAGAAEQGHSGHAAPKSAAIAAQQTEPVTITLSDEKRQLIGVRTAVAEVRRIGRNIRTVGRVDLDETRLAYVNTRIAGWVKKLFVDFTGKDVKKGEPLLSIYSPDLVSAQEEYLLAFKAQKSLAPSSYQYLTESQDSLIESAKKRLLLWGIAPEQISEIEKSGSPQTEMTILSPIQGVVIEKMVIEGAYIMPGMNLYKIADLSRIWVIADIYEYEVPLVGLGQEAKVELSYLPEKTFSAKVGYIYPTLDPMTRTVKVRIEVQNDDMLLKPEMFATVEIYTSSKAALAVPSEAVLDSGVRQVVWVEKKPGVYEMREVKTGLRGEKFVQVLSGLRPGEKVVTSGNFLIDSESRLRSGPGDAGHPH